MIFFSPDCFAKLRANKCFFFEYIKFSLDLIEEIQRTGDIFFPKDWLNNTIGKYSSKYAFDEVQRFLKENPNFSPILKRKLLQAIDALYHAQNIKKETE